MPLRQVCTKHELHELAHDWLLPNPIFLVHVDEEGLSHHVFPFPSTGDPDDGQVYLRVQEFRLDPLLGHILMLRRLLTCTHPFPDVIQGRKSVGTLVVSSGLI